MNKNKKTIILLSGGLDSVVSLGYAKQALKYDVVLALTFDYGQKSALEEIEASKKAADYYGIKLEVVKLDWLKNITKSALVTDEKLPENNLYTNESSSKVWVPNRNALFLNIAASYCDSFGYNYILFGANADEAQTFSDNSQDFINSINLLFKTSTIQKPTVVAPLINCSKNDIVKVAMREGIPLEYIRSCYSSGQKHCGKCESCLRLYKALEENGCNSYIDILFSDEEKIY